MIALLGKKETNRTTTVRTIVMIPFHLTDLLCRKAVLLTEIRRSVDVTIMME
jgi:hypothetical protein